MSDQPVDLAIAAALLGVDPSASVTEVRAAFRARATLVHPDRHHQGSGAARATATEAMRQLTNAYDRLLKHAEAEESSEILTDAPDPAGFWWRCPACGERFHSSNDETAQCSGCGRLLRQRPRTQAATAPGSQRSVTKSKPSPRVQEFIDAEASRTRKAWLQKQREQVEIERKKREGNRRR